MIARRSAVVAGIVLISTIVVPAQLARAGVTTRVSVGATGAQADGRSEHPAVSPNGRFVAFESEASDLVVGDTNGATDVFLRDRCVADGSAVPGCTPSTFLVSVNPLDAPGNGPSGADYRLGAPAVSSDGRFVAFESEASDLVPGDTNGASDVFVRDRCVSDGAAVPGCTPTTSRESVDLFGGSTNAGSNAVRMTADGRFLAFESDASDLVASDANGKTDVFVRDRCLSNGSPVPGCTPSTARQSVTSAGAQASGRSVAPALSPDARFIAFESYAPDLVPPDTNDTWDVFVRDSCLADGEPVPGCTPGTTRESVDLLSSPGYGAFAASLSADGRFVAFESPASTVEVGDTNGRFNVFVHDRCLADGNGVPGCTPATALASETIFGPGNEGSVSPAMSSDGRYVAFLSAATKLVPDDKNSQNDFFVRDLCIADGTVVPDCTPRNALVSVTSAGAQGHALSCCGLPAISPDGRLVAFQSYASLVAGDTNGLSDIFVRESVCPDGKIDHAEQCDDGNGTDGDGCSPVCERQPTPTTTAGTPTPTATPTPVVKPCKVAIVKSAATYTRARLRALMSCEARILKGTLSSGTICHHDSATLAKIERARAKLQAAVAAACGGPDGDCGTPDDLPLASIGWALDQCPSVENTDHPECASWAPSATAATSRIVSGAASRSRSTSSSRSTTTRSTGRAPIIR